MDEEDRRAALERFERATELPLLVLALAMAPLLVVPLLVDLPDPVEASFVALDWAIWAVFLLEYLVRLALTPQRGRFIIRNWPDLLIVVVPLLRPLRLVRSTRALRTLRLLRLAAILTEINQEARRLAARHKLHYSVLITGIVVLAAAGATFLAEEQGDGPIDSFGDALWWAITTVTTVGYGDTYPVTPAGRGIAAFLMMAGIAFFGVLTANIAAFFIDQAPSTNIDHQRYDEILHRLDAIELLLRHPDADASDTQTTPDDNAHP